MTLIAIVVIAIGAALYAREVWQMTTRRAATSALIWRLKDEGRITGPDAGALLSALYGDK